jgi:hypothetical protein
MDIGAVAGAGTDVETALCQFRCEPRAGLACASEHEDLGRRVRHSFSVRGGLKRINVLDALFIV